jgi:hypothetical protein
MSILGTVVDDKHRSVREKLARKKYMGVWRHESEPIIRMMRVFPTMVTK